MRAAIKAHLGSTQVSRVVYGAIIGVALVVALEDHPPKAGVAAGLMCATALAVGLAEIYSDIIGEEMRSHRLPGRAELLDVSVPAAAVALGIAFPSVFFVLAAADVLALPAAFTAAKWSGIGLITIYGYLGARLAGRTLPAAILQSLAVALIGVFLILFKALLH